MKHYKIFCVVCDWTVKKGDDSYLWSNLAICPKCMGCTDAIEVRQ